MHELFSQLSQYLGKTIVGQSALLNRLIISMLADGHLLVEGMPGLAKTTAIQTLANGLAASFQRIQFTPDMIPGDITGTEIFMPQEGRFEFRKGPVFNEIILADEINRAPAKVQSALLEAMQERQVTSGGVSRPLSDIFLVMATQNPIDQDGTYALPEAQLDRFMMKIILDYPSRDEELEILKRHHQPSDTSIDDSPLLDSAQLLEARSQVQDVFIDTMLMRYIVTLVDATRNPGNWDEDLQHWIARGCSPRASIALQKTACARAYLKGRDFVEPDDIINLVHDVFNHRMALSFSARAEGITTQQVVEKIIDTIPVP